MKKTRPFLNFLFFLVFVLLMANNAAAINTVKFALGSPPDIEKSPPFLWAKIFTDDLETKGIEIKHYPEGSLGGEAERLDQISQGLLEISDSNISAAGSLDPTVNGFQLPFLFKNTAHFYHVMEKSNLLAFINSQIVKRGTRILALVPMNMTGIATTKKFIKIPSDFTGIRMRSLNKEQARLFEILGANTVVIPWPEIYNALQTGVADGYLNPSFVPITFKHTEILKYYSDVKFSIALRVIICSEDWYKGLTDQQRSLVKQGVAKADLAVQEWGIKQEKNGLDDLRNAGMLVYENTEEERTKFYELLSPQYSQIVPEEIMKLFISAVKENQK